MHRLGLPPERAIVVEDAVPGIAAAKAAGMRSVGVSRHIRLSEADLAISSLAELSDDAFDRLLGSRVNQSSTAHGTLASALCVLERRGATR